MYILERSLIVTSFPVDIPVTSGFDVIVASDPNEQTTHI